MTTDENIYEDVWIPTTCGRCYANCAIKVRRVNGVAVKIEGNPESPMGSRGGMCAKGLAGLQVLYDPNRLRVPLKRTNPEKGLFVDPKWKEISWEEALDEIAGKLRSIIDEDPKQLLFQATTGRATHFVANLFPLLAVLGRPSYWVGGGGLHCGQGAHEVAGLIHGSWSIVPDFKYCNYMVYFGANKGSGSGHSAMITTRLAAEARARGAKFIVFDPMANFAGGKASEWIPIIPGTDGYVALAMCNVIVNELGEIDSVFLKTKTNAPYLISSSGKYVRDPESGKCLVWDKGENSSVPYDHRQIPDYETACEINYALDGKYDVYGISCEPAFSVVKRHLLNFTPEGASGISGVPADSIRRIAAEFLEASSLGTITTVRGHHLPLRPASAVLFRGGEGHENSYHTCFAVGLLNELMGNCDVPGGTLGWPARCNGFPETGKRVTSPTAGKDGFLSIQRFGTSGFAVKRKGPWPVEMPEIRHDPGLRDIFPMALYTFSYASSDQEEILKKIGWPKKFQMMISWGCNSVMSVANRDVVADTLKRIPFTVVVELFSTELAEGFADIVLPDTCYLEENSWAEGVSMNFNYPFGLEDWAFHIGQAVIEPQFERRDFFGNVVPELMERMGKREIYNNTINRMYELDDENQLKPDEKLDTDEIADLMLKDLFGKKHGWDWFKKHGFIDWEKKVDEAYWRYFVDCRVPLYLEHLIDIKKKMEEITKETGLTIDLSQYTPLVTWFPCSIHTEKNKNYDLYCFSYRDVLHSGSHTMEQPWLNEISLTNPYTYNITMNAKTATEKGLRDGDLVELMTTTDRRIRGRLKLLKGIHPKTVSIAACSGHWARGLPIARNKGVNFDVLMEIDLQHVDPICLNIETAVRVKIRKVAS
jgi:molybdopterin-containing oxidoreductase family molybdopterin binding subunit